MISDSAIKTSKAELCIPPRPPEHRQHFASSWLKIISRRDALLSRLLTHFGYQVTVEHSVQSALEQLSANNFDVILSDIGLPDGSGYDLISRAKQQQVVKGVAITALGTKKDIQRSKEAGFDFHLTKPFDVYELRTLLDKFRTGP